MDGVYRLPLVPVFVAYTFGILSESFVSPFTSTHLITLLLLSCGFWVPLFLMGKNRLGSMGGLLVFYFLGLFSISLSLHPNDLPRHVSRYLGAGPITLEGTVVRIPHRSPQGVQVLVRSERILSDGSFQTVEGPVLFFIREEQNRFHTGDRLQMVCRLRAPHGFHNPGVFSTERHLALEQIHTLGFLSNKQGWRKIGEGDGRPWILQIEDWRDRIRCFIQAGVCSPCSGLFEALVLGEQGNIPEEIKEQFIRTGTAHLLAISGDQFGMVAFLSFSLALWMLKRSEYLLLTISVKKWAAGLTIPCIVLYAFLAGGGISVIRSMIMVITFFISILLNRERHLLHTLVFAAFLILIVSPPSLFDVSFQLSFLAVLSILYGVPVILKRISRKPTLLPEGASFKRKILGYLGLSFLASGVAILGTAPFVALHFNRISPIGLMTNLLIIPWVGFLIVPLSLIASLASFLYLPLATLLLQINQFITLILLQVISFFASIPFASVHVSTPTALEVALFYGLAVSALHLKKEGRSKYLLIGLCLISLADLTYWGLKDRLKKDLSFTFLDVGHGDAILVEFPRGRRMLIDGGGSYEDRFDIGGKVIAPFLWHKKISRIDYLVLTHPDPDHFKGLTFIASHFQTGQFWSTGLTSGSDAYQRLEEVIERKRIHRFYLSNKTSPLQIEGVEVSFLNPPERAAFHGMNPDRLQINNASLVLRFQFKEVCVLLVSDIGRDVEVRLIREGHPLKADLLKIPHHGSASSSSPAFLDRVKPAYGILSVGERNIGRLPNPEVMKRYRQIGSKIYRTDRHGAITATTDGERIDIETFIKPDR